MTSFFFQAEDGIRDTSVTGVQTCALPISMPMRSFRSAGISGDFIRREVPGAVRRPRAIREPALRAQYQRSKRRSEERRVGKECRCGGGGASEQKKTQTAQEGERRESRQAK